MLQRGNTKHAGTRRQPPPAADPIQVAQGVDRRAGADAPLGARPACGGQDVGSDLRPLGIGQIGLVGVRAGMGRTPRAQKRSGGRR